MTTERNLTPEPAEEATPSAASEAVQQRYEQDAPPSGPSSALRLLVLAIAAGLIGGAIYLLSLPSSGSAVTEFAQPAKPNAAPPGMSGSDLPPLELKTLDGRVVNLNNLKGKQVVLNFWATWCGPCRDELPDLARVYEEKKNEVEIVAIDVSEDAPRIERYLREIGGLPFTIAMDEDGTISRGFSVTSLPTSLFVDDEGVVRYRFVGGMNYSTIQRKLLQTVEEQEYAKQQEANKG